MRLKWLLLGLSLALAALAVGAAYFVLYLPGSAGRALSAAMAGTFGFSPAIQIRNWVVVEEKKPIAELALVSRETDVERRLESERLGSRAELSLRAAFRVKAGFDLRDAGLPMLLDPSLGGSYYELPAPRVLSIEMTGYEVLADRSGWWNRIGESEKALALRDMQAQAKLEAIRAGILDDCRKRMDSGMAEVSRRAGRSVTVRYRMPGSPARTEPVLRETTPAGH